MSSDDNVQPQIRAGLARSVDRRIIAGVASGLAQAWGWKPWVVRALFAVTTLLAGLGLVLYLLGWLLMPLEGSARSVASRIVAGTGLSQQWLGYGAVVVGALIVGRIANLDVAVLIAGALLVTGYLLYRGDLEAAPEREEPSFVYGMTTRTRPPRPPSYLGRLTIGVLITTLGVMAALDALGLAFPTSRHYAAAALVVIGGGLLVGSIFGRSRGLVVLGLLLLPVLVVAAVADYRFGTAWEYVTVRPATLDAIGSGYSVAAGAITIDLSRVQFDGRTLDLDLDAGIGDIYVQLPPGVGLQATANAIYGSIGIEDRYSSGLGPDIAHSLPGTEGLAIIDADIRIGNISIYRPGETEAVPSIESFFGESDFGAVTPDGYVEVDGLSFFEPRSIRQIAGIYNVLGGQLVLDLTSIRNAEAVVSFTVTGHGAAQILVSGDARVIAASSLPFTNDPDGPASNDLYLWERDGTGPTWVIYGEGVHVLIEEG